MRQYMDISNVRRDHLPPIMKYYRLLGFCYYNNSGQPKIIYKIYCIGVFTSQLILSIILVLQFTSSAYFKSKNAVQQLPAILNQSLRLVHFFVTFLCILRNNTFIKKFYTSIACIQSKMKSTKRPGLYQFGCISLIQLLLTVLALWNYILDMDTSIFEKVVFVMLFIFSYHEYLKEEWLMLSMLTIKDTLNLVNEVLRKHDLTDGDVKNMRQIHSQLATLNFQLNDHFRWMITTLVITTGMVIWSHSFTVIQMMLSPLYLKNFFVGHVLNIMHYILKLVVVCYYCENVKKEVSYKVVRYSWRFLVIH